MEYKKHPEPRINGNFYQEENFTNPPDNMCIENNFILNYVNLY